MQFAARSGARVVAVARDQARHEECRPYGAFVADPATADRSITGFLLANEPGLDVEMAYLAAERGLDLGAVEARSWTEPADWIAAGAPRPAGRVTFRVGHKECG